MPEISPRRNAFKRAAHSRLAWCGNLAPSLPHRSSRASEIRLVRSRDVGLAAEFKPVFGADGFRPWDGAAHIGQRCGPGCREDVFIFDGDMDLQVPAAIVAIDGCHRS